jgi:hypothetical protein
VAEFVGRTFTSRLTNGEIRFFFQICSLNLNERRSNGFQHISVIGDVSTAGKSAVGNENAKRPERFKRGG